MNKSFWTCAAAAVLLSVVSSLAHAAEDCADNISIQSEPSAVIQCLRNLQSKVNAKATVVPAGAVLAFDRPNGCPTGWEQFDEAAERFIIGAGGKYELPYVAGKPKYETGGSDKASIAIENLPKTHRFANDGVEWASMDNYNWMNSSGSAPAQGHKYDYRKSGWDLGGGHLVSILPPYIALYFCKKKG